MSGADMIARAYDGGVALGGDLISDGERAFYYVRVLENPKCRWSSRDAVRAGVQPRHDLPATIQDRAWSPPIWFVAEP